MGIAGNVGFFWVFLGFLEKGVESTFLNIGDSLRPTYFNLRNLSLTLLYFNLRNLSDELPCHSME